MLADLAGYTALTEAHGDERAADIAAEFCAAARRLAAAYGAQEVKTIGDAILLRVPRAGDAVRFGARLVNDIGARDRSLGVGVGMHTGTAVRRGDDWFGAGVNVASRVADRASAGEVLLTAATRNAAGPVLAASALASRGRVDLKNVRRPVDLYALVPKGASRRRGFPVDPVCRMAVDPARSVGPRRYDGVDYYFCSVTCEDAFESEPARYWQR